MKKSIIIKVRENCDGLSWSPGLFDGNKSLGRFPYINKASAIKRAKFLAKITDIPYSDEIFKQHGC